MRCGKRLNAAHSSDRPSVGDLSRHHLEPRTAAIIRPTSKTRSDVYLFENLVEEADEFAGAHRQRAPARSAMLEGWQPPATGFHWIGIDQSGRRSRKRRCQRK